MQIAVFGGTGRTGRRIIEYAVEGGHRVRALARDPAKLSGAGPGVTIVTGDVLDPAAVAATIEGSDAVLSALGGAGLSEPGTAISQGMRNIVRAMEGTKIRRVLAIAGAGVLDAPDGRLRAEDPAFPAIFRAVTREHRGTWEALRGSALEWTLVCTPDLLDGERTGRFRIGVNVLPDGGRSISVEDTAAFMVSQIARGEYVKVRVGLAY